MLMKNILITFWWNFISFGFFIGIFQLLQKQEILHALQTTILLSVFCGALATLLAQSSLGRIQPELMPNEFIRKQGRINLYKNKDTVGVRGWLFLTNQHLFFLTGRLSMSKEYVSIPLSDINNKEPICIYWLSANGLQLTTKQGEQLKIISFDWRDWQENIPAHYPNNSV